MVKGTDPDDIKPRRRDMINGPVYGTEDIASQTTIKVIVFYQVEAALGRTSSFDDLHIYTDKARVVCPMHLQTAGGTKLAVDLVAVTPNTPGIVPRDDDHEPDPIHGTEPDRLTALDRYARENFRTFLAENNPFEPAVNPYSVQIDFTAIRKAKDIDIRPLAPDDWSRAEVMVTEFDDSNWSVICKRLAHLNDPPPN
jgi:hypothetical protein